MYQFCFGNLCEACAWISEGISEIVGKIFQPVASLNMLAGHKGVLVDYFQPQALC